jgi:FkbM family methyltransferase
MKRLLKAPYILYLRFFSSVLFAFLKLVEILPRGRRVSTLFLEKVWSRTEKVKTSNESILFASPDWLSKYRANSFYEKEPETIAFLNTLTKDSILWDVGANIGIYSIYASKVKNVRVYSFEPSLLNVELLFRNVQINDLGSRITILPIALSNKTSILDFYMSKNDLHWAGAHNSIGSNTDFTGDEMKNFITSSQIACMGEDIIKIFKIPFPTHIKIDVDGLEGEVIEGLETILTKVEFILVEVDESNKDLNAQVKNLFGRKNFERIYELNKMRYIGNQLWKNKDSTVNF